MSFTYRENQNTPLTWSQLDGNFREVENVQREVSTQVMAAAASAESATAASAASQSSAELAEEMARISVVRWCGNSTTPPTTRLDGSPLEISDEYGNLTDNLRYNWTGETWVALNSSAQQLEERLSGDGGAINIGNNVVAVDSIATLLTLPMKTGLVYSVESYYPGTGVGGNQWRWDASSTMNDTYGSVLKVSGIEVGRLKVIKLSHDYSVYEFGVSATLSGLENRRRLLAMGKALNYFSAAATVKLPDEDYKLCGAYPVIFPGDTFVWGGKGWCHPVFEELQPPSTWAQNPDGTFKCYGALLATGDPISGNRFSGKNLLNMGTSTFCQVKIKNVYNIATTATTFLNGISTASGDVNYIGCEIEGMPNTGYYNFFPKSVSYYKCIARKNGFLSAGQTTKNGVSNISTYTADFDFGDKATTRLVVDDCVFAENKDEGIQYSSFPMTIIRDNDLRFNQDRAIECDNAYSSYGSTRPNDQAHVYNNDCRGVPGVTNYSMTFNDGYSKDVYLGGNILGNCRNTPLISTCTATGSISFTERNRFYLDDVGLVNGCHAMYLNAGLIDLRAGAEVTGSHSRVAFSATLLSANNELPGGGTVLISNFSTDVTFVRAIDARSGTQVRISKVACPTSRCFARVNLVANATLIEIDGCGGMLNTSASTVDGLLNIIGLATFTLDKLVLKNQLHDVNAATRFPVVTEGAAPTTGRILKMYSLGNYWKEFSFNGGAERLTGLAGLAAKTSALDLPLAT